MGTGKSVLSSSVIDHIRKSYSGSIEDGGFAFFYCNRQFQDHREASSILQSYVRQLSTTLRSQDDIKEDLQTKCTAAKREGSHLDEETCVEQLLDCANLYPQTTIVLDGLDECDEKNRKVLLAAVHKLLDESLNPLKIFIASRPTRDIERQISKEKSFRVDTLDNVKDIEIYVRQAVDEYEDWNDPEVFQVSPDTKKLIIKRLIGNTDDSNDKSRSPPMWVPNLTRSV